MICVWRDVLLFLSPWNNYNQENMTEIFKYTLGHFNRNTFLEKRLDPISPSELPSFFVAHFQQAIENIAQRFSLHIYTDDDIMQLKWRHIRPGKVFQSSILVSMCDLSHQWGILVHATAAH